MNEDIYILAYQLKQLLNDEQTIITLNYLEEKMNCDQEVMTLAFQKDIAVNEYSDLIKHFSIDSPEAKNSYHEMYLKKKALDEHPLVRQYLDTYSKVRDLYLQISDILFGDLSFHMKEIN